MKQTELLGLDYILKSLEKLDPHTPIMFEGERGTGKTTLAFLMAEKFGAPSENISQVNCADNRGIDFHRDLISNLHRSSFFGEKRVLILDEIHGLTPESQNAWLIPLEPKNLSKNTLIVACTTSTEKMLGTLLRRFTRFRTKTLNNNESKLLIDKLCEENGFKLGKIAQVLLAEKSEGIPGLIISNLPKIVGLEDEREIRSLLELSSLEVDSDTLDFFKIFKATSNWQTIRLSLIKLLKIKTPNDVKMGLMNLTAAYFVSDFYKPSETDGRLLKLYHNLTLYNSVLEKASLIVALKDV